MDNWEPCQLRVIITGIKIPLLLKLYAKSKLYTNIFPRNLMIAQQTYMHPNGESVSVQLEILTRKLGKLVLFNKEKSRLKRTYKLVLVQKANFIWHIQKKKIMKQIIEWKYIYIFIYLWKKSINIPVGTFEAKFDMTSMIMARIAVPLTWSIFE